MLVAACSNQMVASADKQHLYMIGNYEYGHRHEIYRFSCNGSINDCEWAKIDTELAHGRSDHVAFPIPNALVNKICHQVKTQVSSSNIKKKVKVAAMVGNFSQAGTGDD